MQLSLRRLLHNRVELLLTFVVPIAFFSVFALIFGNGIGSGTTPKVKVVIVDEIQSPDSTAIVESLRNSAGLRLMNDDSQDGALDLDAASDMVRHGGVTIAIVLKSGDGDAIRSDLLADASDQVAGQVVSALVGRELVIAKTRQAARARRTMVRRPRLGDAAAPPDQPAGRDAAAQADTWDPSELVQIVDVIGEDKANPVVSMYAAGIAVMFLLFGATGGGGVLLEERENTTLDRLLSTELTMDQLLLGKWFYLTALGFVQVCVMFVWGQFVFGIDLRGHLDGFVMMTLVTSSAAAAFGLFLATLCKTRGQLNGLSVILILTMSALGGSMVPRYVMSERMRELGLWTFNAWALDGYDKVFWRDLPPDALLPQLAVLMIAAVGFLLVARALAIRWEFD
ncbi:ABC-2 family transporter protein [Stieleria neptunia]|uniref:ABC-2 family transporter protein n=2 Tax=Stieleria neptunia TaxID=2527979 RepID=A0A518HVB0_9BACT|nr:ABC-2 family transporter protein [Stieleria neptunia]